jgi:hypothetical protein
MEEQNPVRRIHENLELGMQPNDMVRQLLNEGLDVDVARAAMQAATGQSFDEVILAAAQTPPTQP